MNVATILVAAALALNLCAQNPSKPTRVRLHGSRPLAEVADWIEKNYGVPVHYEDPKYLSARNIEDITNEVVTAENRQKNPSVRVLVPRRATAELLYLPPSPSIRVDVVLGVAETAAAEHNRQRHPGVFRTFSECGEIGIAPLRGTDEDASSNPETPLFDRKIRLSQTGGTTLDVFRDVLRALEQESQTKIVVGMIPVNLFSSTETWLEDGEVTARHAMLTLLGNMRRKDSRLSSRIPRIAYRLFYDPPDNRFVCNLHVVMAESKNMEGEPLLSPVLR